MEQIKTEKNNLQKLNFHKQSNNNQQQQQRPFFRRISLSLVGSTLQSKSNSRSQSNSKSRSRSNSSQSRKTLGSRIRNGSKQNQTEKYTFLEEEDKNLHIYNRTNKNLICQFCKQGKCLKPNECNKQHFETAQISFKKNNKESSIKDLNNKMRTDSSFLVKVCEQKLMLAPEIIQLMKQQTNALSQQITISFKNNKKFKQINQETRKIKRNNFLAKHKKTHQLKSYQISQLNI